MSPAVPPSPQEIQRKLSVHSARKPAKPVLAANTNVSGTESDSDSLLTPDVTTVSPNSIPGSAALAAHPPLSAIAERQDGSDSEEEDEDEEGGWRSATLLPAGGKEAVVLHTGYLWKKGERRKTWKKRWFVLRPAHIAYYKSAAEYKLLRLLSLSEVHSCTQVTLKRHENTFGLVSKDRTFYLQAKTPKDVKDWMAAIDKARQELQATSTQTPSAPIEIPGSTSSPPPAVPVATPPPPSSFSSLANANAVSSDSEDASPSAQNFTLPLSSSPSKQRSPVGVDPSKVVVSGYLMKCGSKLRNWRKRWFVLTGERLWYSASHMDTKPHRQFRLSDILDALEYDIPDRQHPPSSPGVAQAPDGAEKPHGSHTFKIVTTKRALLLCAPGEEDEIKWLGAIRALIARRAGTATTAVSGNAANVTKGFNPSPAAASDTSPSNSGFTSGGSTGLKGRSRGLSVSGGATGFSTGVIEEEKRS